MRELRLDQSDEYETVLDEIRRQMYHPYLNETVGFPEIHHPTLGMGAAILSMTGWAKRRVEAVLSALLLVHQGLGTHDEVTVDHNEEHHQRQLYVLAGDYFSSKYYRILAEQGLYDVLRAFAVAIQEINEAKSRLSSIASNFELDTTEYLSIREQIGYALLYRLAEAVESNKILPKPLLRLFGHAMTLFTEYKNDDRNRWNVSWVNLYLWQTVSVDERRWLATYPVGADADSKLRSLRTKYQVHRALAQSVDDAVGELMKVIHAVAEGPVRKAIERLVSSLLNTLKVQQGLVEGR